MRRAGSILLALVFAAQADAQSDFDPADLPEQITASTLLDLDLYRLRLVEYYDNVFQYQERKTKYLNAIAALEGKPLMWPVVVDRVTTREVMLRHCGFGRTRVILTFFDESGSIIPGNMRFNYYCSTPSAKRYAVHATQPALRIGVEISEEFARTLRKDDRFYLTGRIEGATTRLEAKNSPDTLVFATELKIATEELITDWKEFNY